MALFSLVVPGLSIQGAGGYFIRSNGAPPGQAFYRTAQP